jgi:hypothetical protein
MAKTPSHAVVKHVSPFQTLLVQEVCRLRYWCWLYCSIALSNQWNGLERFDTWSINAKYKDHHNYKEHQRKRVSAPGLIVLDQERADRNEASEIAAAEQLRISLLRDDLRKRLCSRGFLCQSVGPLSCRCSRPSACTNLPSASVFSRAHRTSGPRPHDS